MFVDFGKSRIPSALRFLASWWDNRLTNYWALYQDIFMFVLGFGCGAGGICHISNFERRS